MGSKEITHMQGTLRASDVNFLSLATATFCVQCELISANNTPRCLACGSKAVLSLSRVLGGSMRGQTTHLIADAELDRLVRSLLHSVPRAEEFENELSVIPGFTTPGFTTPGFATLDSATSGSTSSSFFTRHHLRVRHRETAAPRPAFINPGELDLEPGISIIAEKAQALTGATGAAIALRKGDEIICRARTGRTAPDLGVRLQTDRGLSAECVRTGEVLLCNDAETNPRVDMASCRRLGVRSILVAPLRHFRRTLGVFEVLSSTAQAFDNNDVATMQFLSGMMVAAISRKDSAQDSCQLSAVSSQEDSSQ